MGFLFVWAVFRIGTVLLTGVIEYQNQKLLEKVKSKNLDMEFERLNNSIDQAITDAGTNFLFLPIPKVEWMNDAIYYTTNQVFDEERTLEARNPRSVTLEYVAYSKDVITTNNVWPSVFPKGNDRIELGFRSDGVIVWRNRK